MVFSLIIEVERKKRGLNKAEMAILLGMSERMYDYYISGKYDGSSARTEKYINKLSESKFKNKSNTELDIANGTILLMKQNESDLRMIIEYLKQDIEDLRVNNKTLNRLVNSKLDELG